MPRPAIGKVVETQTRRGRVYALRFTAYGERRYVTLGSAEDGWDRRRAQDELENVMADVRRGLWRPRDEAPSPAPDPTFHEFASEWFDGIKPELRPKTATAYLWQLSNHLLPYFAEHRLSEITVAEVDRYRQGKVREAAISASSINKTLVRLGQILDVAEERELISRNPMRVNPRRRRLKVQSKPRTHLDRAVHVVALLDAAGQMDAAAREDRQLARRALLAVLVFAGLRLDEALSLRWKHVQLATGTLVVPGTKTVAADRVADLLPVLRDELLSHAASATDRDRDAYVFPTTTGRKQSQSNVRQRILLPAIRRANERLERDGEELLPEGLTLHGLRHTAASILVAIGEDVRYVMSQIGHADPAFTIRLYTHDMRRNVGDRGALAELVGRRAPADTMSSPIQAKAAPQ